MKALLIVAILALAGCTDEQVFLKRPEDGATAMCASRAFGLISTIMEISNRGDCIAFYNHEGYVRQ
jgi:hypothetical protein